MTHSYDERSDAQEQRACQVGDSLPARPQRPQAFEDVARTGAEIDQQVEQVRWLMRREPMLEVRELRIEN